MTIQENQQGQTVTEPGVNIDENNGNGSAKQEMDVSAEIEKVKEELEQKFKSEIAGLNRKNSELHTILKKKEMEGKTEAEQKELLLQEKKQIENEIEQYKRTIIIDRELNNAGLPVEFAKRIIGQDEANIKEDVRVLKEYVDNLVAQKVDSTIQEKLAGKPPEGGVAEPGKQMKRADFDKLDPFQRSALVKEGLKIID